MLYVVSSGLTTFWGEGGKEVKGESTASLLYRLTDR